MPENQLEIPQITDSDGKNYESGNVCKSTMFKLLYTSKRLERALKVICDVKEDDQKYYAFSEGKFIEFVCQKFHKIYQTLEKRYQSMSKLPRKKKAHSDVISVDG